MLNLIKSMLIILSLMIFCIIPSTLSVVIVDYLWIVSDAFKSGLSIGVWMFSMVWTGGFMLSSMAMEGGK